MGSKNYKLQSKLSLQRLIYHCFIGTIAIQYFFIMHINFPCTNTWLWSSWTKEIKWNILENRAKHILKLCLAVCLDIVFEGWKLTKRSNNWFLTLKNHNAKIQIFTCFTKVQFSWALCTVKYLNKKTTSKRLVRI